jgi:hypothetical protein
MKERSTYIVRFDETALAQSNRYASELRRALLDAAPGLSVDQWRDDRCTQDFGGILVLALGTSSLTAIVRAIGNWLQRRSSATLTIETPARKIIATNITSRDAAKLSESLLAGSEENLR